MKTVIILGLSLAICSLLQIFPPVEETATDQETIRAEVLRLLSKADSFSTKFQYDSAIVFATEAAQQAQRWLGENDSMYISSLMALGQHVRNQDDFVKSESLFTKVLALSEQMYGADHPKVAEALMSLASVYTDEQRFAEAEQLLRRALNIQTKASGPQSRKAADILLKLSYTLYDQKRYDESISAYREVIRIYEKCLGSQHREVASAISDLGVRYRMLGRFAEAEECLLRSLSILDVCPDSSGTVIVESLIQLGKLYVIQARYQEAEPHLKRALKILNRLEIPEELSKGALLMNELGSLYWEQGKLVEAEEAYAENLRLREKKLQLTRGRDPNIAEPLNNLGELCWELGRYTEAEQHFNRALEARATDPRYGREHPFLIYSLLGLGQVYTEQGRYFEADSMLRWALRNVEKAYGKEHLHVAWCLETLGNLYRAQGKYKESESSYSEALHIREDLLGAKHPQLAACLGERAKTFGCAGEFDRSISDYKRMQELGYDFVQDVFSYASEDQKMRYVLSYPLIDHSFLSLAVQNPSPRASSCALKMVLQGKAAVLDALMAEKEAVCCSYDDETVRIHEQLSGILRMIANMCLSEDRSYRDSLDALYHVKDSLESELSRRCTGFGDALAARRFGVPEIAAALPEEVVLWEFIRYEPYDFAATGTDRQRTGQARYLAFTLNHSSDITLTDLGKASDIDSLVSLARKMIYDSREKVYSDTVVELEQELCDVTRRLYALIFAPLIGSLAGRTNILIALDGQLGLLPFEILAQPNGKYVVESFTISYLSSGHDLLKYNKQHEYSRRALVMADPDFDLLPAALSRQEPETTGQPSVSLDSRPQSRSASDCVNGEFNRLPQTRQEADAIVNLLEQKGGFDVDAYYDDDASEETLKGTRGSVRVVHIGSHAFFCEDIGASRISMLENPLLRSALALSGANRTLSGQGIDPKRTEDGLLTAFEVSGLNLIGTELVVLSACETGVGDVKNGEGVFGLRRAFQHAGAQAVVMSMWKVPDNETRELMDHFYGAWLSGQSKKAALREATLKTINSVRAKYGVAHPYFWGGFVLVGDPN
jgi:CHAT domain-containing protein/tetratricopeptide (TPR) repeat protein